MSDIIFVTGGTGLTGANVCEQLIGRGDAVRALVRNPTTSCVHRRAATR
jgi:dihydroflavonol-4-reductase